jgi:hypothetical protein
MAGEAAARNGGISGSSVTNARPITMAADSLPDAHAAAFQRIAR